MPSESKYMTVAVSFDTESFGTIFSDAIRLEAIEAVSDSLKLRLTYKNNQMVSDVLSDSLSDEITQRVQNFEEVEGLLSIPDYLFTCDGLKLGRLSVFGSDRESGRTNVTLRWSKVTGNIQSVIKVTPELLLPPQSDNARLAFQVLDCVLQPIFELTDIGKIQAKGQSEAVKALIDDFTVKRDELEKYAKMLKIYLEHEATAGNSDDESTPVSCPNKQRYLC